MLSAIRPDVSAQRAENCCFCFKWGALIINTLQKPSSVKKAERPLSACNKAVIALRRRPRCNAKRPLRECREALTAKLPCRKQV